MLLRIFFFVCQLWLSELLEGPALSRLHAQAAATKAVDSAKVGTTWEQEPLPPATSSATDQGHTADASDMMVSQSKGEADGMASASCNL